MIESHTLTGGNRVKQRERDDFYRTPACATCALLQRETFEGTVWECACGDGAISKLLPLSTISTDLFDRGFGEIGIDFLTERRQVNNIVTNPPYKLAQQFVEHALECADRKVAMLLKLNFLESIKRYRFFQQTPLRAVYVFSKRLSFDKGVKKSGGRGLLAYAWYVWEQGYTQRPQIEWIR
jgi:hypothetical protein